MNTPAYNIFAIILVFGIVWGIKLMSSPKTAVKGNLLGAVSIFGAIILTLVGQNIVNNTVVWVSIAVGGTIGYFIAMKVAMIQMPQLIAMLNGFGGGASAFVALIALLSSDMLTGFSKFTGSLALIVGAITLSGSLLAAAKLARLMDQKPIIVKGHTIVNGLIIIALIMIIIFNTIAANGISITLLMLSIFISLLLGVVFIMRIGGADMPVTISLLNSLSGVAGAIAGFAIYNPILVAVGAIVGAAGLILTRVMCRAMNRSLMEIITGKTTMVNTKQIDPETILLEKKDEQKNTKLQKKNNEAIIKEAKKLIIVPGYGMALAQAQHLVKELAKKLEEQGKEVKFAIHPVAGRMPGHMNVLLAEADVDYEQLYELEAINPQFIETDLVIVVGANDVVNPAAITAVGTPIYGMPILRVDEAKYIFICNKDTQPGYSGVDNLLYQKENVSLLLGDAAQTIKQILECIDITAVS
ncbi:MAG: NAD(P)(+) transhydrogenase (Re/Si-specific) subunit beta [Clostridia bacterium]|nr:NAD(P)(+) transhydrogenase (Re/Si-specific) subunit beta [Clostridia bacterium]